MTDDQYKEIVRIKAELSQSEDVLKAMNGCLPSSGLRLECKTGYSDMGRDIERTINLSGDLANECWQAIRGIVKNRINDFKERFKLIDVNGL